MSSRAQLLLLLVLVSPACADIDYLSPGTCGNGVVEPGTEDCDTSVPAGLAGQCGAPSDPSRACRLICNEHRDCPSGWSCAPDATCVHASGGWTEGSPLAMALESWTLLDLDHDGTADIAGVRGGELHSAFGDGKGGFVEPRVRHVDRLGDPAFGGGIAVPTPEGVVVFAGDPTRELAPRPLAYDPEAFRLTTAEARMIWGLPVELPPAFSAASTDGCHGGVAFNTEITDDVLGRVFDLPNTSKMITQFEAISNACPPGAEQDCIGNGAAVFPRPNGGPSTRGGTVAFSPPNRDRVTLVSVQLGTFFDPGLTGYVEEPLLPPGHTVSPHALPVVFTPGVGSVEVLVPTCQSGSQQLVRAFRQPDGSFGPFEVDARFAAAVGSPCGEGPVLLAAGELNGDAQGDYVFSDRVLLSSSGGELVSAKLPLGAGWREAVLGDFDSNQKLDLAAVRADSHRIDVLYSEGGACEPGCGWMDVSIDLDGRPRLSRAANLDGIGGDDLAFVVSTSVDERVQVAFASGAKLAPPKTVAVLEGIQHLEVSRFRSMLGYCDTAMDLAISRLKGQVAGFTLLMGSGHGELYAPLPFGASAVVDPVVSVVLADSKTAGQAWLFAEAQGALYAVDDVLRGGAVGVTRIGSWTSMTCPDVSGAAKSAFLWSSADLDADGVEEVVGVERRCSDAGATPGTRIVTVNAEETSVKDEKLAAPARELSELLIHDFDGDAALDLALAHGEGLSIYWGGADGDWSTADPLEYPTAKSARSLAVVQADATPGDELALLSADGLVVLSFSGRALAGPPRVIDGAGGERVRSADVNGDSIDDLLVSGDQQVRILLGVPHRPVAR